MVEEAYGLCWQVCLTLCLLVCHSPPFDKEIAGDLGIASDLQTATIDRKMRNRLIDKSDRVYLWSYPDVCGFNLAMCTRGGVETAEVDPKTMAV